MDVITLSVLAVKAAAGALGRSVLEQSGKAGAAAGKHLGQRLVQTLLARAGNPAKVRDAVQDVADAPDDEDALGAFRLQLRKALEADPALAEEIAALLREDDGKATNGGAGSVTIHGGLTGINSTGDGAHNVVNIGKDA